MEKHVTVVGGGLAGVEAAWQAARLGADVTLYEMRPHAVTALHKTSKSGELTGSNSFGLSGVDRATGLLAEEMRQVGSVVVQAMDASLLNAKDMYLVDRTHFADCLTELVESNPSIEVRREELRVLPTGGAVVVATGPMMPSPIARALYELTGEYYHFYFGCTSPIIDATTIELERTWIEGRFGGNQPAYRNCGLTEDAYTSFCQILEEAGTGLPEGFGRGDVFHEYMPVEIAHLLGERPLCGTVLNPVGLTDPEIDGQAFAVCQLAPEDADGCAFSPVSLQTGLNATVQEDLLHTIPALAGAKCLRYGQLYRAVYVNAPALLSPCLELLRKKHVFIAGALIGLPGYLAAVMSGWLAGLNAALTAGQGHALEYPCGSLSGALCDAAVSNTQRHNGPLTLNFSVLPIHSEGGNKDERKMQRSADAIDAMSAFAQQNLPEFVELPGASK